MKIYTTPLMAHAIRLTGDLVAGLPRDIDKKIYVFCESKATLSFESEIARRTGGTFNVEVLSFSRYLSKRVRATKYVSKAQAALLVRKLMKENKGRFVKLNPDAFSVPKDVYGVISQLKAAMVSPDDLKEIMDCENGGAFIGKLADISAVYRLYEDYLKTNELVDESNYLSLMSSVVEKDETIRGAKVIVSGLQSFTKQTLEIVKTLNRFCNVDFVCVCAPYPAFTNESVNKLSDLFKTAEVIPVQEEDKTVQYATLKGLFNPEVFETGDKADGKIRIIEASSIKDECDRIAARIRYEVVNNNRRYKDFSIICQDVPVYAAFLKESFYLYDIPLYADLESNLDKHPVIGLIGGLIDLRRFNYLPQKAVTLAKSELLCGEAEATAFIKYVYENAVSRKQMKTPFDDIAAEGLRNIMVSAAEKFSLSDGVDNYTDCVKSVLDYLGVFKRGEMLSEKLNDYNEGVTAKFNDVAFSEICEFLDEIKEVCGNVKVSLNEFKNIIVSMSQAVKISTVPQYNDTVYLGDYRGGRLRESKIVFMAGLTSDVPNYKADVALLNDRELTKMDGYKVVIEPKLQIVNERERENLAVSMASFTDKLFVSYPLSDKNGKPVLKSEIIDRITQIFSDVYKEESKNTAADLTFDGALTPLNFMSVEAGKLYFLKKAEQFRQRRIDDIEDLSSFWNVLSDKNHLESAFNDVSGNDIFNDDLKYDGKFSPTQVENYFSCPYKAFAANVLRLTESATGDTKVYEIGNVLHNVFEKFVGEITDINNDAVALSCAERLFDEELKVPLYARYLNKSRYQRLFKYLKKEAVKECLRIYKDLEKSDFKPLGVEVEFNEGKKDGFKPLYLETSAGSVALRGKVDRVDAFTDGQDKYFRIIDYKSGKAEDDDSAFYCGNKIQLYLYMNVFARSGYKPAGAHYFKVSDDFSSEAIDGGEYFGKSLLNKDILIHMDKDVGEKGSSQNLGVKQKADGSIAQSKSTLTEDEFDKYLKYAIEVSRSGAEEMIKGCFIPSPTEKSCEYCKFKALCGYDAEVGDKNRNTANADKNSIIHAEDNNGQ